MPHYTLLIIYKTNVLPVLERLSIVYDNCSDGDKRMRDKAQL